MDANECPLNKVFWNVNSSKQKGALVVGSKTLVEALSEYLEDDVKNHVTYGALATAAQEFLANCPRIIFRVKGPKRCWGNLYKHRGFPDHQNEEDRNEEEPQKKVAFDYFADNYCHMISRAALRFGTQNGKDVVSLANQLTECWFEVQEIDENSLHVGKHLENIEPKEGDPATDDSMKNAWRVGGGCDH